jgi:hypothetical protein
MHTDISKLICSEANETPQAPLIVGAPTCRFQKASDFFQKKMQLLNCYFRKTSCARNRIRVSNVVIAC